ncbi:MAG TPA: mannose-1-phosphate guanylyltransferase [Bacteroidaceae bacterium]|nr:mannose-1-phosphate guanylyltransferase [Bacteroidaceae bacterium]
MKEQKNNHLVIMAGGIGSRFWPLSTKDCPKQFIDVLGCGRTLIQLTVDRFDGICSMENIWIVTSEKFAPLVRSQLPEISDDNILMEPCRRNTAPCIAYVSWKIKSKFPNANIVVAPSDHIVMNVKEFQRVIKSSLQFIKNSDAIVTLGMKPNRPETGYGYIEADLTISSPANNELYRVDSFKEKPDLDLAKEYFKKNNYFWNSGIFIWNVHTVINAFRVYQPSIAKIFESMLPIFYTDKEQQVVDEKFPQCENISVDYAIMEYAEDVFVFPADFGWSDLGTWGSLYIQQTKDLRSNAVIGKNISIYKSDNCMVFSNQEKKVVVIGMRDCIVAEHDNQLLVCNMLDEQLIKNFSE